MPDFLPDRDADFLAWMTNFHTYAAAHTVEVSLDPSDVTEILNQKNQFAAALAANVTAQDAAQAARAAKEEKRASVEAYFRAMARRMTYNEITPEQRASLGLPLRDGTRTRAAVPTTKPVLQIDISEGGRHEIRFADEGTPTKKKKPEGVAGVDIFFKKGGEPPAKDGDWSHLAYDTNTPYLAVYDQADAGTTVWYRARWINTHQEPGPWSAVISAKVPG